MSKYCYFDISIDSNRIGRIVIKLYTDQAINGTDNFLALCKQKEYKDTYFHRIIRNFMVQGGNTDAKRGKLQGSYPYKGEKTLAQGGSSIFKSSTNPHGDFHDENLMPIDKPFLVCYANLGKPDTNRSQFFITVQVASHLTGKHSVIGEVVKGKSVVRSIEHTEVFSTSPKDINRWVPENPIVVEDCGQWNEGDDCPVYNSCNDTVGGDIYEEYPDDNTIPGLDLDKSEQAYQVCQTIKKSAGLLYKAKKYQDSFYKYVKCMRYCNELIPEVNKDKDMNQTFLDYKKTLYLNLALTSLLLKNYNKCIDYCGYLFEFVDDNNGVKLTNVQISKAFYRLGMAYKSLKKYTEARDAFAKGHEVNPSDSRIVTELEQAKKLKYDSEATQRHKLQKLFG